MKNEEVFTYNYSADENREVENIRKKYLPKRENKLETLKKLDNRIKTAGVIESLSLGTVGCLIFGVAMCFGLNVFTAPAFVTVLLGVSGVIAMLPAYPLYKRINNKAKSKFAPEILKLSEEILDN